MATLNELVTALSFKVDSKTFENLSKLQTGFSLLSEGIERLGKVFSGGKSFTDIIFGASKEATDLINLSNTLGLSLETIQKWKSAAEQAGVGATSVLEDISQLRSKYRMSEEQILDLSRQIQQASPEMKKALQEAYGLSNDTVTLFSRGPKVIREFFQAAKDGELINEEEVKKLDKLNQAYKNMTRQISILFAKVSAEFAPAIEKNIKLFTDWIKEGDHAKWVMEGIFALLILLGGAQVVSSLTTVMTAFARITQGVIGLTKFFMAFGKISLASLVPIISALGLIASAAAAVVGVSSYFQESKYEKRKQEAAKRYGGYASAGYVEWLKNNPSPETLALKANEFVEKAKGIKFDSASLEEQLNKLKPLKVEPVSKDENRESLRWQEYAMGILGRGEYKGGTTTNYTTIYTNESAGKVASDMAANGYEGDLSMEGAQ